MSPRRVDRRGEPQPRRLPGIRPPAGSRPRDGGRSAPNRPGCASRSSSAAVRNTRVHEVQKARERLRGRPLDGVEGEDALEEGLPPRAAWRSPAADGPGRGPRCSAARPEARETPRSPSSLPHRMPDCRTQSSINGEVGLLDVEPPSNGSRIPGGAGPAPRRAGCPSSSRMAGQTPSSACCPSSPRSAMQKGMRLSGVGRRAEDRGDVWGVGGDVGRHDDDVGRAQARVLLEHAQDLVVQDLDLPHGAVAAVDDDRPVAGGVGRDGRVGFAVPQV